MACGGEYSRQEVGDAAPCLWVKVQVRSVADADALGDGDHGGGGVGADVGGEGLQPLEGPVGRWGALHRAREHDRHLRWLRREPLARIDPRRHVENVFSILI